VLERAKDVQYSSKQRFSTERVKELGELLSALGRLLDKLPADFKADPDAQKLAWACEKRDWTIAHLVNHRLAHVSQTKDYEFSRATVQEHWAAGLEDVRRSVANVEWIKPRDVVPGVRVYELPG
jgi:NTE family protein